MSVPATATGVTESAAAPRQRRRLPRWWFAAALFAVLFALSVLEAVTGADDLVSRGTVAATLIAIVPIMLAGLGGLWSERAGVVNIGLEGMMVLGTWFAGWAGYEFGAWWGLLFGILGGAMGGLLHAVATVTFGVDQIVSGVAINIIAPGVTRFLAQEVFTDVGGSATSGPTVGRVGRFTMPILAGGNFFGWDSPDVLGNLVRFVLLPGQRFDTVAVPPLIDGIVLEALIADTAFDGLVAELNARGAAVAQHPRRARPLAIVRLMHKWRHLIENFFGKLKKSKRIALRSDKTDQSFAAMIHLIAAVINSR